MKVVLSTEHLQPILKMLAKSGPDLIWLLASSAGDNGSLIATIDTKTVRWSLRCPAEVNEEGGCYVSWQRFHSLVMALDDLSLTLNGDDKTLEISTESMKAKLPTNDGSLFPLQRQLPDNAAKSKFEMPTFSAAVRAALSSLGKPDEAFAYTSGIAVVTTPVGGLVMATDRKRCLCKRFICRGDPMEFLVPSTQLDLIASFPDAEMDVSSAENSVRFRSDRFICDISPFNVRFPTFREHFMKEMAEAKIEASFDYNSLVAGLSLAHSASAGRDNVHTYLDLSPVDSRIRSNGDRSDEIDIRLQGMSNQPVRLWVRPDQVGPALSHLFKAKAIGSTVSLRTASEKSTLFFPLSDDHEDFFCVAAFAPVSP